VSAGGATDADELMTADDYLMMDMSDTLFSSLNPPTFNTPRDLCMYHIDSRVTTCLENLEMSGNLKHVREMSEMLLTVAELSGKCQGKNLVMEKCPKTVHY